MFYTYVLYSESRQVYYKGFTENVTKRFNEHNNNLSRYTAGKGPWRLIIVEQFDQKRNALMREKGLKRCKSEYFEWLKLQPLNLAHQFQRTL